MAKSVMVFTVVGYLVVGLITLFGGDPVDENVFQGLVLLALAGTFIHE